MRTLVDDDENEITSTTTSKGGASQQPAWMRSLLQHSQEWLAALPEVSGIILQLRESSVQARIAALVPESSAEAHRRQQGSAVPILFS